MQILNRLEIGDTVSICFPFVGRHEGVVTGYNRITARSRKYMGVSAVTFTEFTDGKPEQLTNHGYIGKLSRRETVGRAIRREGEMGYSLFNRQCIHFTNEVNGLPKYSRMEGIVVTLFAMGLCAYAGYQHKIKRT